MEPLIAVDNITIVAIVMICTFLVGISVAILYCYMIDRKRKKLFMDGSYTGISGGDDTNSYVYFGSPGYSFKADRRMSVRSSSGRKSSEDSTDLTPRKNSFLYSLRGSFHQVSKFNDKSRATKDSKTRVTETLNVCNFSTDLEMTGFSKNVASLQITTASSLCEQCLAPPPSPPTPLLGTSISLPPTAVEITKTALGLTNPTSNVPIVCDSCLSPSKFGDTSRTLKLPNLTIGNELRQRKPSGIKTNPRSMNTYLQNMITEELIKVPELKLETSVNLSVHDYVEDSFDSLLSPSRAYEWLSGNPLETSYEKSPDDPKLVKIQPKIKMSKHDESRHVSKFHTSNQLAFAKDAYVSHGISKMENKEVRKSPSRNTCFQTFSDNTSVERIPASYLEAFPPFTSPVISPGDSNYDYLILTPPKYFQSESNVNSSNVEYSKSSSRSAVDQTNHTTLRTCKDDDNKVFQDVIGSSYINAPKPLKKPEDRTDSTAILAWDSTYESLKTMESSMKLEVTPSRNVVNDIIDESLQESNDSQLSVCPIDKSCISNVSLAWDNAGEHLDCGKQDSILSLDVSLGSVDFDKIVCDVAPSLTKKNDEEFDNSCIETKSVIRRRRNSDTDASSPLLKKYASSIDVSVDCNFQSEIIKPDRLYETSLSAVQLQFNSPMRSESFYGQSPVVAHDSPIKFIVGNTEGLINQPFSSISISTSVCEAEEYLSTCESLDSFRTVMNF